MFSLLIQARKQSCFPVFQPIFPRSLLALAELKAEPGRAADSTGGSRPLGSSAGVSAGGYRVIFNPSSASFPRPCLPRNKCQLRAGLEPGQREPGVPGLARARGLGSIGIRDCRYSTRREGWLLSVSCALRRVVLSYLDWQVFIPLFKHSQIQLIVWERAGFPTSGCVCPSGLWSNSP